MNVKKEQFVDTDAEEDGEECSYHYEYVDYEFNDGEETYYVRHYVDEEGEFNVSGKTIGDQSSQLTKADVMSQFFKAIIDYLYKNEGAESINVLGELGYTRVYYSPQPSKQ
jgi:hypothetical protein